MHRSVSSSILPSHLCSQSVIAGTGPCSAVAVGDFIYVLMHGKRVYRYDRAADTYLPLAELPLSNWFTFDVTTFGCYIYAHGGASEGIWSKAFFQVSK